MADVSARDALRYATEDGMLALYAVVFGGWVLLTVAGVGLGTGGMAFALGVLALVAGAFAILAGGVAIAYKLLAETGGV